uniref:Uncharacterized protein n=1 Tax=Tetraselmis sp. GSL018 TaxID=582737 RepID=A0A061RWC6_9CHLO|eukprot:CAMPEP_0177617284 /NCGR_PEP_ID=MMETSP0419_2-20121207/24770_1 /TAXON_ID=582737 /ORGANISM="Tetraselmis sp., Strain GSL018" /LENGTH=165 /DNA_ID=CAMNT_0019115725 /DNA_START=97 /DNA_END=594 /DNA_ORIENTATION=-
MSETCWKRQPTTVGRGIYSQYKPEHLKEWIERDDRRQQKGLYGSIPVEPLGHLTSYRDSLYKQTPAPRLEKLHNANSKSLAELRKLWAVGSGAIPTAATEDGTTIPRTRRNEDSNKNRKQQEMGQQGIRKKASPNYVHHHHFGWNAPTPYAKQADSENESERYYT